MAKHNISNYCWDVTWYELFWWNHRQISSSLRIIEKMRQKSDFLLYKNRRHITSDVLLNKEVGISRLGDCS
jgi:hypothetical protein